MEQIFADLAERGRAPQRPAARVGLHRREHAEPDRPDDRDPRRRLRRARQRGADVHGRQGHRESQPARPPPHRGHVPDAAVPHRRRQARAAASCSTPTAGRSASPARSPRSSSATCRRRRRPRPRGWRSTATACSATSPRSNGDLTRKMSAHHDIAYCATNWYGMAEEDIAERGHGPRRPLEVPDDPRPAAAGHPRVPVPRPPDEGPAGLQRQRRRSASTASRRSRPTSSTSTATARARSSAARSPPSRRTSPRATLAEAGMNYSLLLDRSVDFDDYLAVLKPAYPKRYDRLIGIAVAQLLWDRGETDGYANHVTADPLPGHAAPRRAAARRGRRSPGHRVQPAGRGRDDGRARAHARSRARAGSSRRDPTWLLTPIDRVPARGSAYFLWDTGSPRSPVTNTPPRAGHDPHDDTPNIPAVQKLKDQFWHPDGAITDVCAGKPCTAPDPAGERRLTRASATVGRAPSPAMRRATRPCRSTRIRRWRCTRRRTRARTGRCPARRSGSQRRCRPRPKNAATRNATPPIAIKGLMRRIARLERGWASERRSTAETTADHPVTTSTAPIASLGRWLPVATTEQPIAHAKTTPSMAIVERQRRGATSAALTPSAMAIVV